MIENDLLRAVADQLGIDPDRDDAVHALLGETTITYRLDEDGGVIASVDPQGGDAT